MEHKDLNWETLKIVLDSDEIKKNVFRRIHENNTQPAAHENKSFDPVYGLILFAACALLAVLYFSFQNKSIHSIMDPGHEDAPSVAIDDPEKDDTLPIAILDPDKNNTPPATIVDPHKNNILTATAVDLEQYYTPHMASEEEDLVTKLDMGAHIFLGSNARTGYYPNSQNEDSNQSIVYSVNKAGSLTAYNAVTGQETLWGVQVGKILHSPPTIANGVIYLTRVKRQQGQNNPGLYVVQAINTKNEDTIWEFETAHRVFGTPAIADNIAYFGATGLYPNCNTSTFYAVRCEDGKVLWEFNDSIENRMNQKGLADITSYGFWSSPIVVDGIVYTCRDESTLPAPATHNRMYALDAKTGKLIWQVEKEGHLSGSPAILGTTFFMATGARSVASLGAFPLGKPILAKPEKSHLLAMDSKTGKTIWDIIVPSTIADTSVTVANNLVYCGSVEGHLYAFHAADGKQKWKLTIQDSAPPASIDFPGQPIFLPPSKQLSVVAVSGNTAYVSSMNYYAYAINALTGKILWKFNTNSYITTSPAIRGNILYINSSMGYLHAIDKRSGKELWKVEAGYSNPIVSD